MQKCSLRSYTEEGNTQVDLDQWLDMEHFFEIVSSTHTLFGLHEIPSIISPFRCKGSGLVHVPLLPVFFVNNLGFDSQMYGTAYR